MADEYSERDLNGVTTLMAKTEVSKELRWLRTDESGFLKTVSSPSPDAETSTRLDEASATISYVGSAPPGSLTSAAVWSIKRLDSTSGLVVLWADGNSEADNIWNNRASLSYS